MLTCTVSYLPSFLTLLRRQWSLVRKWKWERELFAISYFERVRKEPVLFVMVLNAIDDTTGHCYGQSVAKIFTLAQPKRVARTGDRGCKWSRSRPHQSTKRVFTR